MSSLAKRMPGSLAHSPLGAVFLFRTYVANIQKFGWSDWLLYLSWIGTLAFVAVGTVGITVYGASQGVQWPTYVWVIPLGAMMFCGALAVDDIGHRTLYKADLAKGEGAIHQMIIATAVPSVICLCLSYQHPDVFRIPALVLTVLSFFYSALDEAMHWLRYTKKGLDVVEMWAHFVAITGHALMMAAWWQWFSEGYTGLDQAMVVLGW